MGIWGSVGFATIILSAAVKSIPSEVIESARVEGASERQVFFHFLRHMRPYWRKAALVLLANLVVITISVIPPWFGKYLIDDAFPNKNWGLFFGIFAAIANLPVKEAAIVRRAAASA